MSGIFEKLRQIPIPIWIGLGLVVIFIVFISSKNSSNAQSSAPATSTTATQNNPVTDATVGTQGAQPAAGTDQELGNLSQITQSGFGEIAQNERVQTGLLQSLNGNMSGIGTPLTQFGSAIQTTQSQSAMQAAANYSNGQPVGQPQSTGINQPPTNTPAPTPTPSG
jgi:hypothetical protein